MMFLTFLLISIPFVLLEIVFVNIESYYMLVFHNLLFALTVFSIFKGGCTDPGIIPRQSGSSMQFRAKNYNVVINGSLLKLSYCQTCSIFKPPRTSHLEIVIIVVKDLTIIVFGLELVLEKEIINIFIC